MCFESSPCFVSNPPRVRAGRVCHCANVDKGQQHENETTARSVGTRIALHYLHVAALQAARQLDLVQLSEAKAPLS